MSRAPSGYHWSQQINVPSFHAAHGGGVERPVTQISGSEIVLFVIEGIVRDVHLAINAAERPVGVKDRGRIVIDPGRSLFEKRRHQNHMVAARRGRQFLCSGPGYRFSQVKQCCVFPLAEILRLKKLRQAHDMRAAPGRVRNPIEGLLQVLFWLRPARHLHQRDRKFIRRQSLSP